MGVWELLLIALGLSMDAFAASLCRGLGLKERNPRHAAVIALFFGGFQAVMPLLGWLLGKQFEGYITLVDHWIAFGLLLFIGGQMICEVFQKDTCPNEDGENLNIKALFFLAVATSIDALAVGITFACLQVSILPAVSLVGVVTFVLSYVGVFIGHRCGARLKAKAELAGGIVLILIGTKILLEHLHLLP